MKYNRKKYSVFYQVGIDKRNIENQEKDWKELIVIIYLYAFNIFLEYFLYKKEVLVISYLHSVAIVPLDDTHQNKQESANKKRFKN